MIRILHLSDFHYKDKHDADFQDVGGKIADAIKDEVIDLVVFSGDLVYDTEQSDKIDKAAKCLIEPIKAVSRLSNDRILIAPGNHDMKTSAELPMIKQNFSTYKSYMDIDTFASNALQLELSLENFKSYNRFISDFYGESMAVQPLYVCHTPVINGCKLGLIAFNSSSEYRHIPNFECG